MPPTQAASHIAAFPQALVEPCILASSNSGDFVLDPFFGSGTVGLVAKRLHFFGIGTNGLTQYLLAADRGSPELTHFQDALHPAGVAANPACDKDRSPHRKVVGVCGESAFVPDAARILIGLGVNELSLSAARIPKIKAAIRQALRYLGQRWLKIIWKMWQIRTANDGAFHLKINSPTVPGAPTPTSLTALSQCQ
jgi:hypothetical protein